MILGAQSLAGKILKAWELSLRGARWP